MPKATLPLRRTRRPRRGMSLAVIDNRIVELRGVRVMFDRDLAALYGVSTKALNQAVARNIARFPRDFMFRLTASESRNLRSQYVTSSRGHGGSRHRARTFTEHGVAMLSSVLRSRRAIRVNVAIMRAFARLRGALAAHADVVRRIDDLERRYDGNFAAVFQAIRELMAEAEAPPTHPRIGFRT